MHFIRACSEKFLQSDSVTHEILELKVLGAGQTRDKQGRTGINW